VDSQLWWIAGRFLVNFWWIWWTCGGLWWITGGLLVDLVDIWWIVVDF